MAKKQRKPRKGFTRSQKEWEESIAAHIGRFIDRLSVRDVVYGVTFGLGAWHVYNLIPKKVWVIENPKTGEKKYVSMSWGGYCPYGYHCYEEETDRFMLPHAAMACLGTYMLMKTDVSDIVGAFSKIAGAISTIT